jgi:hypothetical protein
MAISVQPATERTIERARQQLREDQETGALKYGLLPRRGNVSGMELSLQFLNRQHGFEETADPNTVKRGVFKFDRKQELRRLSLGEDLLRRVDPGPYEDPNYLALLAFQAASAEMGFEVLSHRPEPGRWSHYLLGTVHEPQVNAFADNVDVEGATIIELYSGLIDFIYQSSKALIEVLNPHISDDPRATTSAASDEESIVKNLNENPEPVNRLYKTLEAYFYHGYPRAFWHEEVPSVQHPSLGMLVGLAERWVVSHEYGHGLTTEFHRPLPPEANKAWVDEYIADQNATILAVVSASQLDGVTPEFPLSSANFVLACLEILRRAVSIVQAGEANPPWTDDTHPPNKERAENNVQTFYRFFDVVYDGPFLKDLNFVLQSPSSQLRQVPDAVREQIRHSFDLAKGMLSIWKRVAPMLLNDYANHRPLHPMWLPQSDDSKRGSKS